MANPQIEQGYTRIANSLLRAIYKYITNPTWIRICLLTIRVTYGFHRKESVTNYKSFVTHLNLTEEYIKQVLIEMESAKIVRYFPKSSGKFRISFNKNFEEWTVYK